MNISARNEEYKIETSESRLIKLLNALIIPDMGTNNLDDIFNLIEILTDNSIKKYHIIILLLLG